MRDDGNPDAGVVGCWVWHPHLGCCPMIWLVSVALADGLPLSPKPAPPSPIEGECAEPMGLTRGLAPSPELIGLSFEGNPVALCSATVLPVSQYLDLDQLESWGNACARQYRVLHQTHLMVTSERTDWKTLAESRQAEIKKLRRWYNRPTFNLVVGGAVVAAGITAAVL